MAVVVVVNRARLGLPAQGALPGCLAEVRPRWRIVTGDLLLPASSLIGWSVGPRWRVFRGDPRLLASSWIGVSPRPISLPDYTVRGPPRSNLTDPRDRDTLHFDFTAGGSVRGRCGFLRY